LVELGTWQVRPKDVKAELGLTKRAYVLVSAEVMGTESRHLVEDVAEVLFDLVRHVDLLLEQIEVVHACVPLDVNRPFLLRIELGHVWDQDTVDLHPKLFFSRLTDRQDTVLGERVVNVFLVVVNRNVR
jgi:hypothetical protein